MNKEATIPTGSSEAPGIAASVLPIRGMPIMKVMDGILDLSCREAIPTPEVNHRAVQKKKTGGDRRYSGPHDNQQKIANHLPTAIVRSLLIQKSLY
jgi:hypothetical protein